MLLGRLEVAGFEAQDASASRGFKASGGRDASRRAPAHTPLFWWVLSIRRLVEVRRN